MDDSAVGGFFEDLTVLMFVLVGVVVIVLSGVWSAAEAEEDRDAVELGVLAHDLLGCLLIEIAHPETMGYIPTTGHIQGLDLVGIVEVALHDSQFCVSVVERHPEQVWLCGATVGCPEAAANTGFASGFVNAVRPDGMISAVEVMVLVW
mgnify:CR=1 FL=1